MSVVAHTLFVEMLSDWHVGTGQARTGSVDSLVLRDESGFPCIGGKTLVGLWRDACEILVFGLDGGRSDGPWARLVDRLFGSQPQPYDVRGIAPVPAALTVRRARLDEAAREVLGRDARLREATTFVKPGAAIDPTTGRARTKFYRVEEMARAGALLVAPCRLDVPDEHRRVADAFLAVGAGLLTRLGGKRRRGAGRCRVRLDAPSLEEAVEVLRQAQPPDWEEPEPEGARAGLPQPAGDNQAGNPELGDWLAINLEIELLSPLVVPLRTVGNLVETLDYLPGHHLLPRFDRIARDLGLDPAGWIARGEVVCRVAHPEVGGGRGRPMPFALWGAKDVGDPFAAAQVRNRFCEDLGPGFKQLRSGYLAPTHGQRELPQRGSPPRVVFTHNVIEDSSQRPGDEAGVYSYEALDAGSRLRGIILLRRAIGDTLAAADPQWWRCLAADDVAFGRSKKDDYGYARLTASDPSPFAATPPATSTWTVWCLSDLLVRGEDLGPDTGPAALARALSVGLGVPVSVERAGPERTEMAAVRVRRHESWQRRWGLPRPSLVGIQAGSCARVTVSAAPDPQRWSEILAQGLGERTAEGFGEVAIDAPLLGEGLAEWSPARAGGVGSAAAAPPAGRPVRPAPDSPAHKFVEAVEESAWRELIRRKALALGSDAGFRQQVLKWELRKPTPSQVNNLRDAVRGLGPFSVGNRAAAWLRRVPQSERRKGEWPRPALEVGEDWLTKQDRVWQALGADEWPRATERDLRRVLWGEAVAAVLGAAAHAHAAAGRDVRPAAEEDHAPADANAGPTYQGTPDVS